MGSGTILGIGALGIIATGFLIWLIVYRYSRAKKREGAAEVMQKEVEDVLDDSMRAKRIEEAARTAGGGDSDWARRMHRKYRRD